MIDVELLGLGDFVYLGDKIGKIIGLDNSGSITVQEGDKILCGEMTDIFPIPITLELLWKAGFDEDYKLSLGLGNYVKAIPGKYYSVTVKSDAEVYNYPPVKYFHEIQGILRGLGYKGIICLE